MCCYKGDDDEGDNGGDDIGDDDEDGDYDGKGVSAANDDDIVSDANENILN